MPLRLVEDWTSRDAIGEWRLPGEPIFAKSHAYTVLARDLRRYVREEVAGRSFLIAGHRGAGKTAMVSQAVLVLRNDILTDSADIDRAPIGRRGRLQRPLIVKLVGQSLLAPPPRKREPAPQPPASAADRAADGTPGDRIAGARSEEEEAGLAGSALVHLTIALYRAFAAEIAEGIAVHALKTGLHDTQSDRFELAAQLALDLDSAPDPALLRSYWSRIGRLEEGVLWPAMTDATLKANVVLDQGMREMVALSTAAQAFRICLGDVTETEKRQNSDKQVSTTEARVDYKDLLNRLGALGAGALAGSVVGAGEGAAAGVGTGLAVWLLSGATLSWSGSRERKRDRIVDYEFLRDRSVQTLDRDLPLVIDRIRQTGLAPVFVIDELDKVADEDRKIADIIGRLKHLVADYGFFCFLTGRDYFDRIEQKVGDEAYPSEHTYFSARLLVVNRPSDLFEHFHGIIVGDGDPTDDFGAAVFALFVLYRSKLNFTDASREIARWCDGQNRLTCTDQELLLPARFRLAATYQIAIDHILAGEEANDRFEIDPVFAQLALDTLYYLPRRLARNSDSAVAVTPAALESELLARMRPPRTSDADAPPAEPAKLEVSAPHLRELQAMLDRLIAYLRAPASLKDELMDAGAKAAGEQEATALKNRADIVVSELGPLVARLPERPGCIRFLINEMGRATAEPMPEPSTRSGGSKGGSSGRRRTAVPDSGPSQPVATVSEPPPRSPEAGPAEQSIPAVAEPASLRAQLAEAKALVEAFGSLLAFAGVDADDLRAADLLPGTVTRQLLSGLIADIASVERNPGRSDSAERALSAHLALAGALDSHGDEVAAALPLLEYGVARALGDKRPKAVLSRMARYFDSMTKPVVPRRMQEGSSLPRIFGNVGSIKTFEVGLIAWRESCSSMFKNGPTQNRTASPEAWARWRDILISAAADPILAVEPVDPAWEDIWQATDDLPPGNLFRLRLMRMNRLDWSRAALAALPRAGEQAPAPAWLLFAALRALGFDRLLLRRMRENWPDWLIRPSAEDETAIDRFIEFTGPAEPATLHIYRELTPATRLDIEPGEPILSIGSEDYINYLRALDWLVAQGAFRDVTHD